MKPVRVFAAAFMTLVFSAGTVLAMMPLITDDAGTQGRGKFQVEMGYELQQLDGSGTSQQINSLTTILTGGASKNVDIIVTIPALVLTSKYFGGKTTASGLGDISLEVKWRFYEYDGFSFAVKPGLFLPSGDSDAGLGNGDVAPRIMFIATKELEPFTFHANVGFTSNQNQVEQNEDIWHVSVAAVYKLADKLSLLTNGGVEGSHSRSSDIPESFVIGGLYYNFAENLDFDIGAKGWFSDSESGWSFLAGTTFRF